MNAQAEELDAIALHAESARRRAWEAYRAMNRQDPQAAEAALLEAMSACGRATDTAVRLGAQEPEALARARGKGQEVSGRADVLQQLAYSDTPARRRLLSALIAATQAAAEVDQERGDDPADGFAAVLEHYAAQMQEEIHGPSRSAGKE